MRKKNNGLTFFILLVVAVPLFIWPELISKNPDAYFVIITSVIILGGGLITIIKGGKNPNNNPTAISISTTTNNNVALAENTATVSAPTTVVCLNCGSVVNASNKICPNCLRALPQKPTMTPATKKYVCKNCSAESNEEVKFCPKCGSNQILAVDVPPVQLVTPGTFEANSGTPINKNEYDWYLFDITEDMSVEALIKKELAKIPDAKGQTLASIEKRKLTMTVIYCILILMISTLYVSYHTNFTLVAVVLIVITVIFMKITGKYGLEKYLVKEVKSRPDEKISYIIASTMSSATSSKLGNFLARIALIMITIGIPLVAFSKPHLVYERVDGGYNVRYYTIGLLQKETDLVVPKTYRGENVIGIRGDTFENMKDLETIVLPDSIKEIRGGAFKNCTGLRSIDLPAELIEIHGNAFENCTSLEKIVIPNTVINIGGESFLNCSSLNSVELSTSITEVHGSTFENCTALSKIVIPEGVTRIGGSAFRNCHSLSEATIPKTVTEIGSSAFRGTALRNVCIPKSASVNERAFKETNAVIGYYEEGCKFNPYQYPYTNSWGDQYE